MDFATIFNGVENLFSGGVREHRRVIVSSGDERFTLPVTPQKYSVQTEQSNKIVDILDTGEMLLFGTPKLKRLKFGSFFPATRHRYPFVVGDTKEPAECCELLLKWKENKAPVRVIITDSPINLMFAIMNFDVREQDGTRDIYFELDLTEYREWNVPQSNYQKAVDALSGLKDRAAERSASQIQQFLKGASDVLEASKIAYGSFDKVQTFIQANKLPNVSVNNIPKMSANWKW